MDFVKSRDAQTFTPEPGMRRQVLAHTDQLMLVRHYFENGWVGARHSHPHHQLVYVISGSIRVDIDGKVFDVRAGDSFVVDGDVAHKRVVAVLGELSGLLYCDPELKAGTKVVSEGRV